MSICGDASCSDISVFGSVSCCVIVLSWDRLILASICINLPQIVALWAAQLIIGDVAEGKSLQKNVCNFVSISFSTTRSFNKVVLRCHGEGKDFFHRSKRDNLTRV